MSQVADYNIANASGASVRSDLNAVFDAIKTLNSGGTDPANPEAFMPYVDTADSNNLKIRNANNNGFTTVGSVDLPNLGLLPKSGGTMTGQILGAAGGGAGVPEYSFVSDEDTGMFRAGTNVIGFTTAGALRTEIGDFGVSIQNGARLRLEDSDGSAFVSLKSPNVLSGNVDFTLPSSIVNGGFMKTDSSGNLSFSLIEGVPTGAVFCMAENVLPTGYVKCDGASYSRTGTYAALFNVIGTRYGAPSNTTFNVPDLRGEFIRGYDPGRGVDSPRQIGSLQGDDNKLHNHAINITSQPVTLVGSIDGIGEGFLASGSASGVFSKKPDGTRTITESSDVASSVAGVNFNANHSHAITGNTANSGGDGITGESRPRNIAMMYIIKV